MSPSAGPAPRRASTAGLPLASTSRSEEIVSPGSGVRSESSGTIIPSTNTMRRVATPASTRPASWARAFAAASGGGASGLASRISARRSVYFHSSMRRCGRPAASKRRNAASRRAAAAVPASRGRSAAKASTRPASAAVLIGLSSAVMASRPLVLVLRVAVGLELERELLAAGADDASLREHVHDIRHDMVEQALVMGDDDHRALRRAQPVDPVRDQLEGVDVEAGIGLVEHRELRLEQRPLQNLVALLLAAAGEADIARAAQHVLVDRELRRRLAHPLHEFWRRQLLFAARLALGIERG